MYTTVQCIFSDAHHYVAPHLKRGHECEKFARVYQREDDFIITFKVRTHSMGKHMQNIARMKRILFFYIPYMQSVHHCNRPQSEDTFCPRFVKCPHFNSIILTLVLALNVGSNTLFRVSLCEDSYIPHTCSIGKREKKIILLLVYFSDR